MTTIANIRRIVAWYFLQNLLAFDQRVNALLGGWSDETISSRSYRLAGGSKFWHCARVLIDSLFFWQKDHCKSAYESENLRRHLPPEFRGIHAD